MRCIYIEERIVGRGLVGRSIPIHLGMREITGCMVVHHIENHSDTFLVACIDEIFIVFFSTVSFVHGEEIARIVSPTIITVKFLCWHQLDGIHTHFFQIRKFAHGSMNVTVCSEITQQQFVDNQFVGILHFEFAPIVGVFLNLEYRGNSLGTFRIRLVIRISRCRNIGVVVRVENLFAIRVTDANRFSVFIAYIILECIFLIGIQSADSSPPTSGSVVAIHLAGFIVSQGPMVEITDDVSIILAFAILVLIVKNESHGLLVDNIDTFLYSCRKCFLYNSSSFETFVL